MSDFAKRLKMYRNESQLSLEAMGEALKMQSSNYAKYENGSRTPNEDTMLKIAKVLGMSYRDLVHGRERNYLDLLHSYLISVALGEPDALDAYYSDTSDCKPHQKLTDLCDQYGEILSGVDEDELEVVNGPIEGYEPGDEFHPFYRKYLFKSEYSILAELCKRYRYAQKVSSGEEEPADWFDEYDFSGLNLFNPCGNGELMEIPQIYKVAFLSAVTTYLEVRMSNEIIDEVREAEGKELSDVEAMQLFAIKVFVPYMAILNKVFEDFALNNVELYSLEGCLMGD